MITWMMITGIALAALCAGFLAGALMWRRHPEDPTPPPQRTFTAPGPLLWDIHSLLNIMSRFAVGVQIPSILLTGDVEIRHGPESTATAVVIAYKPLPYEKLANLIQETISSYARVEPPPD